MERRALINNTTYAAAMDIFSEEMIVLKSSFMINNLYDCNRKSLIFWLVWYSIEVYIDFKRYVNLFGIITL